MSGIFLVSLTKVVKLGAEIDIVMVILNKKKQQQIHGT